MNVFFIRHAEAIDYETETVKSDEYRYITEEGRKETRKAAKILRKEMKHVNKFFSSPLIRAVQTAELFAAMIKFKGSIEIVNELQNEYTTGSVQDLIRRNSGLDSIALVGHEPKMSVLIRIMSDKKSFSDFSKSGVCLVELKGAESGKLIWYFDPEKMDFIR